MAFTLPAQDWFMIELVALLRGTQNGGIYANKPGYHNTRKGNKPSNYSVAEFVADRRGPDDKAAGYDWTFPDAQSGRYANIIIFSDRLLRSGQDRSDPRLDGWREFYGQADYDQQVEGWDFQKYEPSSSDPSHLWHIHMSELREFVGDYENKRKMLSVLRGETYAQYIGASSQSEQGEVEMGTVQLPKRFAYSAKGELIDSSAIVTIGGEWAGGNWLGLGNATATIWTHWSIDPKKALVLPEIAYQDKENKIQWIRQPVVTLEHFHELAWLHIKDGQFAVSAGLMENDFDFSADIFMNLVYGPK